MGTPSLLPEVAEADAAGEVAAVYEQIRATLGIPFVGLIYRNLAVEPGRLASAWRQLQPFFADPATWRAAAELQWREGDTPPLSAVAELTSLGLDERFFDRAVATLDAYDRANRLNLLGLTALLLPLGWDDSAAGGGAAGAAIAGPREELLPLLEIDALPAADRTLLLKMSQAVLPVEEPILVPSLLRHFALPGLHDRLWPALRPAIASGFVAAAAEDLRGQAAAAPIPARRSMTPIDDPLLRQTAGRFLIATSTMVVAGSLLGTVLRTGQPSSA